MQGLLNRLQETPAPPKGGAFARPVLASIGLLYLLSSLVGVSWGLPGKHLDPFLFGGDPPWAGETIARLAGTGQKFDPQRGADVDVDPLTRGIAPIPLTKTPEDVAKIYLRYRLYSNQPDEMITLMALAGMRPRQLQLDAKLYQYGGLFIYPVGALIKLCGLLGLIEVRSDVVYYLDHPDEFAKFYVVARAYSEAWGLLGVFVVFAIGRRLGGTRAGLLAALLFTLLPVVNCMSHEAKPHLPGAVLMLAAVSFGIRQLDLCRSLLPPPSNLAEAPALAPDTMRTEKDQERRVCGEPWFWGHAYPERPWFLMCITCGAAVGMVLSSVPILILIVVVPFLERRTWWWPLPFGHQQSSTPTYTRTPLGLGVRRVLFGCVIAGFVYLITNPYVLINAFANREVLKSNFGNSVAMYEVTRVGEGLLRVLSLTIEGATLPVVILGIAGAIAAAHYRKYVPWALAIPAAVFFVQFVLIGAGKPGEYGRFGIFTNSALAIATACLLTSGRLHKYPILRWGATALVVGCCGIFGGRYLWNFRADTTPQGTRLQLARRIADEGAKTADAMPLEVAVLRDPAPYCCPPLNFAKVSVVKYRSFDDFQERPQIRNAIFVEPVDRWAPIAGHSVFSIQQSAPATPISWANKPFLYEFREQAE